MKNEFYVGVQGDDVVILAWNKRLTREQALNLAAMIVGMIDPGRDDFDKALDEVVSG